MKKLFVLVLGLIMFTSTAFGYDATVNFKQPSASIASGWNIKAGPTKGGPYPNVQDCGKPAVKADGTYDCKVTGYTANPVYLVVAPYDSEKKEHTISAEATASVTIPAPTDVKVVITITTVSRLTRYGNIIADTTIKRESVPLDTVVKEGTVRYRRADGTYYTRTTITSG